jgi:hypothetical protein
MNINMDMGMDMTWSMVTDIDIVMDKDRYEVHDTYWT